MNTDKEITTIPKAGKNMAKNDLPKEDVKKYVETRHVLIYGYTREEIDMLMRHYESQLPDYIKLTSECKSLMIRLTLTGEHTGPELLRFKINKYQQQLKDMFAEELVTTTDRDIAGVMGDLLRERELTVSCAESCTGGNIAHNITRNAGSSAYFLGSVVSYSNDVKAGILGVSRNDLARYGAVSKQVVEQMTVGVSKLMHSDCAIATSGIAGPDGGSRYKPVGTVWMAAKYGDHVVTELKQFSGDRDNVIECATYNVMVMLIKLLRNTYTAQEDISDE